MISRWPDRYVGLPFVDGGRSREGVDCWGLVRLVFAELVGITLPDYAEIAADDWRRAARAMIDATASSTLIEVDASRARPFDFVFMRGHSDGARPISIVNHIGIMAPGNFVLHAEEATNVVMVPLESGSVRFRIAGIYRYHALA